MHFLSYCIKLASTNSDVTVRFNIPRSRADPDAHFVVITLASWVDMTFHNSLFPSSIIELLPCYPLTPSKSLTVFPPNAADFGRIIIDGDSQPLSRASLRTRSLGQPRVYFQMDPTYDLQRQNEYGVRWPYGFVVSSAPAGSLSVNGHPGTLGPSANILFKGNMERD